MANNGDIIIMNDRLRMAVGNALSSGGKMQAPDVAPRRRNSLDQVVAGGGGGGAEYDGFFKAALEEEIVNNSDGTTTTKINISIAGGWIILNAVPTQIASNKILNISKIAGYVVMPITGGSVGSSVFVPTMPANVAVIVATISIVNGKQVLTQQQHGAATIISFGSCLPPQ